MIWSKLLMQFTRDPWCFAFQSWTCDGYWWNISSIPWISVAESFQGLGVVTVKPFLAQHLIDGQKSLIRMVFFSWMNNVTFWSVGFQPTLLTISIPTLKELEIKTINYYTIFIICLWRSFTLFNIKLNFSNFWECDVTIHPP